MTQDGIVTTVRFVGTAAHAPAPGQETASCLINETVLLDCGWNAGGHMRQFGPEPIDLTHLLITHCHFDHIYGLPQLLMWRRCQDIEHLERPLVILGPSPDIQVAVSRALDFLRSDPSLPSDWPVEVVPLLAGQSLDVGTCTLSTCAAIHRPIGLAYRLDDHRSGSSITVTGDTAYSPEIALLAEGSDLLIHEAAGGPREHVDPRKPPGHSGALDAAEIARASGVGRLFLTHCDEPRLSASVRAARQVFPETYPAVQGQLVEIEAVR